MRLVTLHQGVIAHTKTVAPKSKQCPQGKYNGLNYELVDKCPVLMSNNGLCSQYNGFYPVLSSSGLSPSS